MPYAIKGTKIFEAGKLNAGIGTRAQYSKVPASNAAAGKMTADVSLNGLSFDKGVCAALSALWLKKMFSGTAKLAMPDQARALIIYARGANHAYASKSNTIVDDFDKQIAELAELKIDEYSSQTPTETFNKITLRAGSYYINVGPHAVAAISADGGYYFFDPNEASWQIASLDDFNDIKDQIAGASVWRLLRASNG